MTLKLLVTTASCLTALGLTLTACQKKGQAPKEERLTIMAWNVENLFDTLKDENRADWEYLPKAYKDSDPKVQAACNEEKNPRFRKACLERDWSETVLAKKMHRLGDTIRSVRESGPSIVIFPEVENERVLKQLVDTELTNLNYQTVILLEGEDMRGIDIGVISKLPLAAPAKLHIIDFKSRPADKPAPKTRGILHVPLMLATGETLHVLGVHFPSQSNPSWQRKDAVEMLNKIQHDLGPDALIVVGGDFNISPEEEESQKYFSTTLDSKWIVSHIAGCKDCVGTYNFRNKWSFLDALLFSENLQGRFKYSVDINSFATPHAGRYQKNPLAPSDAQKTYPAEFDPDTNHGVSDHFPIVGDLFRLH
jgi:endonuclease/exonuclease/phosphatase family metal-dependent hydrolase